MFREHYKLHTKEHCYKEYWNRFHIDYFHSYVSGATISFIKHWVQDNNRMEPNIVADHLFKIIFNGPLRLMAKEQYK